MSDYISRQAAFEALEKRGVSTTNISRVPIADVRENVRGEWISHDLENGEKSIDKDCCSVCGERFREIAMTGCEWNFCPNCGADMRGDNP